MLCIVGFRIWNTEFLIFSFITNSTSRMHAHTGIKYFHKIHHPPKKWGEAVCILAGARGSSSLSSLLFFFWWLIFFLLGNLLKYAFPLPNKHDCSAFLTFVCFCFAWRPDPHLKAKYSYTNNKAPYETLSLPREKGYFSFWMHSKH